jgi:hypothetical protein
VRGRGRWESFDLMNSIPTVKHSGAGAPESIPNGPSPCRGASQFAFSEFYFLGCPTETSVLYQSCSWARCLDAKIFRIW